MDDSELLGNTEFRAALRRHVIYRYGKKGIARIAAGEGLSEEQAVEALMNFDANNDLRQRLQAHYAEHGVYPEPSDRSRAIAGFKAMMAFYDEQIEQELAILEKMEGTGGQVSVIRLILQARAERLKEWLDEPDSKDTGTGATDHRS